MYLRFLFRLGDRREEEQSLYESFEALLDKLGIQIEIIPDEDRTQEATKNLGNDRKDPDGVSARLENSVDLRIRSRRASFSSMYDAGEESTRATRSRAQSQASMSRLDLSQQPITENRPSTRATTRDTEKTTTNALSSRPAKLQIERRRLTAEDFTNTLQHLQRRNEPILAQSDRQPHHAFLTALRSAQAHTATSVGGRSLTATNPENGTTEASAIRHAIQPSYAVGQHERFYSPSKTQLLRDADTFQHYRIRSVARDAVEKWCFAALQARDQHEHMERLAVAHDTEILLRQAFEHWRLRLHAKKQAAETARHFNQAERRAVKARDLYLLTKAFTHWAQCASDEVLRLSLARHRVLGIKYFHAWHDITSDNQAKMRRQGLRKFFGIWKQRYVRTLTDGIKAELVFQESLARDAYWRWFWSFCERRAPEWRAGRLKRKYLFRLVATFSAHRKRHQQVTMQANNLVGKRVLSQWLEKAQVVLSIQREAAAFYFQQQTTHALQSWRLRGQYAPLVRQVSNIVDWRVAGVTFAIFVNRYRYQKQAEYVNRLRILRAAWSHWNDRLRWQTLAHRTDDRYLLEALYKWVVAERYHLSHRLYERKLKQRFLHTLEYQCSIVHARRERSRNIIEEEGRKRCLLMFVGHWRLRLGSFRQAEQTAFEFYSPKAAQDALKLWSQSSRQLQKLDVWAKDANFFFVARKLLKRWHTTFIESRKHKRRDAYVQIRRESKMKLATSVLRRWRSVLAHFQNMERESSLSNQNRLLSVGTGLFDHWKDRFDLKIDQDYQANQRHNRRLLENHLYMWIGRIESQSRLDEMADLNVRMRVSNIAFGWLHKLRLKLIELKGQEANAESLRGWYEKRHFHNILRNWQEQSTRLLNRPEQDKAISSRRGRRRPEAERDENLGLTRRAEDWTEFDIGDWIPAIEAQSSTTPLPGYLSTPSKRAARAKALVRVSTTPAGTPFEHRLRSELGSAPRTSRRGGFGRSTTALKASAFGVILEDSPRTPEKDREGGGRMI